MTRRCKKNPKVKRNGFWTVARRKRLLKFSELLTLGKLSLKFHQPEPEIERILQELKPGFVPRIRIYYVYINKKRMKVTEYAARPAYGANTRDKLLGSEFDILPRL